MLKKVTVAREGCQAGLLHLQLMHCCGCDSGCPTKLAPLLQVLAAAWGESKRKSPGADWPWWGWTLAWSCRGKLSWGQWRGKPEQGSTFVPGCGVLLQCMTPNLSFPFTLKYELVFSACGFMQTRILLRLKAAHLQNNHFRLCLKCSPFLLTMIFSV